MAMGLSLKRNPLAIAAAGEASQTSVAAFRLYLLYTISYFLHFTERIHALALIRPDLILVLFITGILIVGGVKLGPEGNSSTAKLLNWALIYILVSLPFIEYPGSVLRKGFPDLLKVVAFFYFTFLIVDTDKRLRTFVLVAIACQVFRVLEPLFLHITEGYWGDAAYLGGGQWLQRLSGAPSDVVNPNGLGFLVITAMPFMHYLMLNSTRTLIKLLYLGLLLVLLYALMLTGSRSSFVGLVVVVAMLILKSRHRLVFAMICAALVSVAIPMMSPDQRDRYLSLTDDNTKGAESRDGRVRGIWRDFDVGMHRPIFGFGVGTSKEANWNFARRGAKVSHTLYAEVFMEIGGVGSAIYYLFLLSMGRDVYRAKKIVRAELSKRDDPDIRYLDSLIDAVQVWSVMCLVFSIAQYGLSEFHWYLVAGMTAAIVRQVRNRIPTDGSGAVAATVAAPTARRLRPIGVPVEETAVPRAQRGRSSR
jgi:putative inorganic carbon (HCO3(-)) transporter